MAHPLIPSIKHGFMAYRNGIVADTLRKAGYPHRVIFGLQLPQISEIFRTLPPEGAACEAEGGAPLDRHALGLELWADREVRESRLLAAYLLDPARLSVDESLALAADTRTPEEADILVFRTLRHHPCAREIAGLLSGAPRAALDRFLS
ncbi:MAG: hypothetical protein K2O24_00505 [Muribaculaceae bacterium]|nr:hypothetical protein [Muribaculaceae bacterium]